MVLKKYIALLILLSVAAALLTGCGQRSEEELFTYAQQAQENNEPIEAVRAYRELIETYPEGEHTPKALFMIGFVYSEQVADSGKAIEAFEEFLSRYPEHELAESAGFMVKALKGETADPVLSEEEEGKAG
ncbi:MAG: tetratricopeptide repeat protein [candidate division Zixibacteria bacterium]|nr:tetratricopeptide repeat protein [candidate division Zixibacteria bacterium]